LPMMTKPLINNTLMDKPCPPADDDCCGGGACNPCVWDHYYAELQKWRIEQAKLKEEALKEQ